MLGLLRTGRAWPAGGAIAAATVLCVASAGAQQMAFTNVTERFEVVRTNEFSRLDRRAGTMTHTVRLAVRNTTGAGVTNSLYAVVDVAIPPDGVPATGSFDGNWSGPDGTWPLPKPYVDLTVRAGGAFSNGTSVTVDVTFVHDMDRRLSYFVALYEAGAPVLPPPTNRAPDIVSTPLTNAVDGLVYFYDVEAVDPDGDVIAYRLANAPSGMRIGGESGVIRWVPERAQLGPHDVQVIATDTNGASDTQTYTVTAGHFNDRPTIFSVPITTVRAGTPYAYDVEAVDPEGDPVSYALVGGPAGMTIDGANGVVRWSPGAGDTGSVAVAVSAADPEGAADTQAYSLEVYAETLSLAVLSPRGETNLLVGETLAVPLVASHPRAVMSISPLPANAAVVSNRCTFAPQAGQEGVYRMTVSANLGELWAYSLWTVHVGRDNAPPVFDPLPPETLPEGQRLTVAVRVDDPDGDDVTLSATNLPSANAWFDALRGEFNFLPGYDQAGTYDIGFAASDGTATVHTNLHITVIDVSGVTGSVVELVVDPPESPTFRTKTTITGNVRGGAALPPPVTLPRLLTGLDPVAIRQGQSNLVVTVTGLNTDFTDPTVAFDLGEGIDVEHVDVTSATRVTLTVSASPTAALGVRTAYARYGDTQAYAVLGFEVRAGLTTIRGQIKDLLGGLPVEGAQVGLYGSGVTVLTDTNGWFTLQTEASGALHLLVTCPNYQAATLDLAVNRNDTVVLDTPLTMLKVGGTVPVPGSLPREATLASILDRGISLPDPALTLEQAKALITDTLLTIGGSQVGVLDAAGNQLNPRVEGAGMLSLTPEGVERHARALVGGGTYTLQEFVEMLQALFEWGGNPPSVAQVVASFQHCADEAWANPGHPDSAAAIALFNRGRALTPVPPLLTKHTRVNRFQCFVLFSGFLMKQSYWIEAGTDRILADHADQIDANLPADHPWRVHLDTATARSARSARAVPASRPRLGGGGVTLYDPNTYDFRKRFAGEGFSKAWKEVASESLASGIISAIAESMKKHAVKMAISIGLGAGVGGVSGALTGGMLAAMDSISGHIEGLVQKMVLAWFMGYLNVAYEPYPPLPLDSTLDGRSNLVLRFERSQSEITRKLPDGIEGLDIRPEMIHFMYLLFSFESAADATNGQPVAARLVPDLTDPLNFSSNYPTGKLQFIIPNRQLRKGLNFFRIMTVQFLYNYEQPFVQGVADFDLNGDGVLTFDEFPSIRDKFDEMDGNGDGVLDDTEFSIPNPNFFPGMDLDSGGGGSGKGLGDLPLKDWATSYQDYQANFDQQVNQMTTDMNSLVGDNSYQSVAIVTKSQGYATKVQGQVEEEITDARSLFFSRNQTQIDNTAKGLDYLEFDEANPSSPDMGKVAEEMGLTPGAMTPALQENVTKYSVAVDTMHVSDQRMDVLGTSLTDTGAARTEIGKLGLGEKYTLEVKAMDDQGRIQKLTFEFENTPTDLDTLDSLQKGLQTDYDQAAADFSDAKDLRDFTCNNILERTVPEFKDYKTSTENRATKELSTKYTGANYQKNLNTEANMLKQEQAVEGYTSLLKTFDPKSSSWNAALKAGSKVTYEGSAGGVMDIYGAILTGGDILADYIREIRLLKSDYSPCHVFTYTGNDVTTGTPPSIERIQFPNLLGGIIRTMPNEENPKDGYFVLDFPLEAGLQQKLSTGFPAGFLTSDMLGRYYAINLNSTFSYGGRIFRWQVTGSKPLTMSREYVGNVLYYSTAIQFGHSANPLAMCMGPSYKTPNWAGIEVEVQDLFVLNQDFATGKKELLRVPVSLLTTHDNVYATGDRQHIVGRRYLEVPDVDFTGPTDMELGPDPAFERAMTSPNAAFFFSAEGRIYTVFRPGGVGDPELLAIVDLPGMRWSGLAFDKAGKLYFAELDSGRVYMLRWEDVYALIERRSGIDQRADFDRKAVVIAEDLTLPGDIEVETASEFMQHALVVSSPAGIERIPMPIVGRLTSSGGDEIVEVRVKRGMHEYAWKRYAQDPALFSIATDFEQIWTRDVELHITRRNAALQEYEEVRHVTLALYGATYLEL